MSDEKKKINGGDVLVKCLLKENVKYLFGIPGGQFLNMYDAINNWGREAGIETILFRHEAAAAHAADAWARVTNTPGICFGTVGPGATNLISGVGAAWADNIPMITIVPQVNSEFQDSFTLQGSLDQITMYKPITKYQKSIRKLKEIPDAVRKAFREALGGRPQPVLLEIFEDAFLEEIEEDSLILLNKENYRAIEKPVVKEEIIEKALELILNAKKPLIVSGGGVSRSEAWNELEEFIDYLQLPVITSGSGMGTIPEKSQYLFGAGVAGMGLKVIPEADVVLALGCKFSWTMGHGAEPFWKDSQTLIQVDIDPSIIGRAKPVTLGIIGDCKQFLTQILEKAKKKDRIQSRAWLEELKITRQTNIEKLNKKLLKDKIPIPPKRLIKDIFESMDEDAILILDGGDISVSAAEQVYDYNLRKPLSTLAATGMGQLGTAVPYGIGAKLAKPNKQVVAIAGDGAFMINIQDLETAVRLKLKNLVYVVANNDAWGMIKSGQKLFKGKRYIDVDLPAFDYAKCAESFGCYGEVVTDPNEIKPAFERAKNSGKPAVLDVKIDFETPDTTKLMGAMGIL
ncbi:MAG: thiamine pyrophosphate-binding protein [Candidatus Lokiarchaeota archaeon]|nr:thiamine pyrophosphate-binding protein [Candidatus Lokiarchaeota archaeon]